MRPAPVQVQVQVQVQVSVVMKRTTGAASEPVLWVEFGFAPAALRRRP